MNKFTKVYLVANGDLRLSANRQCWPVQAELEKHLIAAFELEGVEVVRAHPFDKEAQHGFIHSQRMGAQVFKNIPSDAPVVIAEAVWQYSHHLVGSLAVHEGPILSVANWDGTYPGIVGMLNLNACLAKWNIPYDSLWDGERSNFTSDTFVQGLRLWVNGQRIVHDLSHVSDLVPADISKEYLDIAHRIVSDIRDNKAILGIFDEGCMGMHNAMFEDSVLAKYGFLKERLSQSALLFEMSQVTDTEAQKIRDWVDKEGMKFHFGPNEEVDLTEAQVLEQCKMYIAAIRKCHEFGCDAIGIQYQQGLKDSCACSDLAEGLMNNPNRPPAFDKAGIELYAGEMVPHFNEVDQGAGIDAIVTNRVWSRMGWDPSTTLHDIRWGDDFNGQFIWVFMISGAHPASHVKGGYRGAYVKRQPLMYFPMGGGGLSGPAKAGHVVWSRVFMIGDKLHADIGIGEVVDLPDEEVSRRLKLTTEQWPIMSAVLKGVSRDQMIARHKANHVQVVYSNSYEDAVKGMQLKAAAFAALGMKVHVCGVDSKGK